MTPGPDRRRRSRADTDAGVALDRVIRAGGCTDDERPVYCRLAALYDHIFGWTLQAGRRAAIATLATRPGETILEVGVGTGVNCSLYPRSVRVVGIDVSPVMLARARRRLDGLALTHCSIARMDAARLAFADGTFDVVYAPYVMSVVSDPVGTAREMARVCRKGGRIAMLNHFRSRNHAMRLVERLGSRFTGRLGFTMDLDLATLVAQAQLQPVSVRRVNFLGISTLVTCLSR
jgi:phosphatidylethanolamine/phosphatidyl-N-methylethanolamine N-methyltransferase